MPEDKLARARQLIALAVASPYAEEGRTAAIAAVRLIDEHKMLSMPSEAQGLAAPPDIKRLEAQDAEIRRLQREVDRLKHEKHVTPAVSQALVIDVIDKVREIETLRAEVARLRALPTMPAVALYVVQPEDTPMSIARVYTGDPRRMTELVYANGHKPTYLSNGWRTFMSLYPGERLRLPASWV